MLNITYIYNIQGDIKLLDSLNYTLEEFKQNVKGCYPNWDNQTMYATDTKFNKPILDNETIREMTREEICQTGDLSVLQDGEVFENGVIKEISKPQGMLLPKWTYPVWIEGATEEEKKAEWFNRINTWKPQVLTGPFSYIHSDGKTYHQKLRVGKDDTLLSTAIQALIRNTEIPSIEWAFDDENNSVLMTLEDLRKLQDTGFVWTQCVYEAERELKAMAPDFTKDINFFKEIAIKHITKYRIG